MSFAGFLQIVRPASRWWRRSRSITITLWPIWLAQRLCPHESKTPFSDDGEIWHCDDCGKFNYPVGTMGDSELRKSVEDAVDADWQARESEAKEFKQLKKIEQLLKKKR